MTPPPMADGGGSFYAAMAVELGLRSVFHGQDEGVPPLGKILAQAEGMHALRPRRLEEGL